MHEGSPAKQAMVILQSSFSTSLFGPLWIMPCAWILHSNTSLLNYGNSSPAYVLPPSFLCCDAVASTCTSSLAADALLWPWKLQPLRASPWCRIRCCGRWDRSAVHLLQDQSKSIWLATISYSQGRRCNYLRFRHPIVNLRRLTVLTPF